MPNEDIEKHPNITHYDYYVCGLKIGNEYYTVKAVIANMADGSRYYDHKLTNIEKGKLIDIIKQAPESSVSISTQTPESSALSDVKDNRLISILQTNSSKIVDENGEPKVVWHGGQFGISIYPKDSAGRVAKWFDSEKAQLTEKGEKPLLEWADKEKAFRWLADHSSNVKAESVTVIRLIFYSLQISIIIRLWWSYLVMALTGI